MSTTSPGGWHPDPTGRFGRRYYDGTRWTDHVVSARGDVVTDPVPSGAVPLAPPLAAAPAAAPPPPASPPIGLPIGPPTGPPTGPAPSPYAVRPRHAVGWGLGVAGVGLVLAGLSLLVLPWGDGDQTRFLDASSSYRDAGSDAVDDLALYAYVAGGAFVLLLVTAVLAAAACLPVLPPGAVNAARVAGALVAGVAAVLHGWVLHQSHVGDVAPGFAAWLGLAGFVVAGAGTVLGTRRVST